MLAFADFSLVLIMSCPCKSLESKYADFDHCQESKAWNLPQIPTLLSFLSFLLIPILVGRRKFKEIQRNSQESHNHRRDNYTSMMRTMVVDAMLSNLSRVFTRKPPPKNFQARNPSSTSVDEVYIRLCLHDSIWIS